MVLSVHVVDAVRRLSIQMAEAPTTGDVAAALDASQRVVQRIVSELSRSGVLVRVGRADRPGLAVADALPPQVHRLRLLIARIESRWAEEAADELAELRELELELAETPRAVLA